MNIRTTSIVVLAMVLLACAVVECRKKKRGGQGGGGGKGRPDSGPKVRACAISGNTFFTFNIFVLFCWNRVFCHKFNLHIIHFAEYPHITLLKHF